MKRAMRLALALLLFGTAGPAAAITYNCMPIELLQLADHVRVHCASPSFWEDGYPRDGTARIEFFAVPKADVDYAKRFLYVVQTALTAGMVVQFQYNTGTLTAGCNANTCRRPWSVALLAPGTDVRIPHVVWPSGSTVTLAKDAWQHFGPFSISYYRKLVMTMTGTGNVDLYVRRGDPPTDTQFTCRPALSTSTESVSINGPIDPVLVTTPDPPRAATYYLAVKGIGASNTYKLSVAIATKPTNVGPAGC